MSVEENSLGYVTKFFEDVIVDNIGYNIEKLFDIRVNCGDIIENNKEKDLLNNINDILFNNRHRDLRDSVFNLNYILGMTLYYDGRNKLEKVIFSTDNYQRLEPIPNKYTIVFK